MAIQHTDKVSELLIKEMFWNVRLGVAAITPAMILYYVLLAFDSGFNNHILWASITGGLIICLNIYFFFGENWVGNFNRRTITANAAITVAVTTIGIGFLIQVPAIKDQNILMTTYGLMIGVLGAAAFVFSCNKYTYVFFSIGWAMPLVGWLTVISPDLARKIFGLMFVVYISAMIFLSRKDYHRRVSLIEVSLNLEDEKQEVIRAHDLVVESTKKLESALQTVTTLKNQQDGDYYLTSLLIQPLAVNTSRAETDVHISFYSEQKKKFEFKNRVFEIGGDINIAHTIQLNGIECSVILNADAMGKSIQGAGGALVLGAVFQSIMDRTRAKKENHNMYPERWMKETFIQLQKVFESFEGSMLVSIFLCVIENKNGAMYCVNAEHPQAVLLRDNHASFLPFDRQYRKLGTPDLNDKLVFSTFALKTNDIVILGSDGRDDINLGSRPVEDRVINEDERLFLQSAERAKGDLKNLRNEIANHGELVDDLTMIRIHYRGQPTVRSTMNPEEARQIMSIRQAADTGAQRGLLHDVVNQTRSGDHSLEFRRKLAILAFNLREFQVALDKASWYIEWQPLDNQIVFLAAAASKNLQRMATAADIGERLRMRAPANMKYIALLIDIYLKMDNPIAAGKLIREAQLLEPGHKKMPQWLSAMAA